MTRNSLLAITRPLLPFAFRRIAGLSLLWIAGSFAPAQAGAHSTSGAAIRPAVLYHNYCSVCHGDKGDGRSRAQNSLNPPPRDFTTPDAGRLSRDSMIAVVTDGKPGTAMTPWKSQMNQKEIAAVVDYVRNTFMPAAASADGNSRGRSVYSKNCSVCHGERGDGRSRAQNSLNPPPRDFTAANGMAELTQQRMIASITYGRPETAMAGFKTQLSKEDISAVVDYIRTGFMAQANTDGISGIRNSRSQAAPDNQKADVAPVLKTVAVNMKASLPNGLKGDMNKGGAFYMKNCATCHGTTGDGRGPRAYFINPKPRNFLHPASRQELNRVVLFKVISEGKLGTEMPAWRHVLTPQEIADVSEFVFQRYIQPSAQSAKPAKAR